MMNPNDLFEKLIASPTVELGGKHYYIVEKDHKVSADKLMDYVQSVCSLSQLLPTKENKSSKLVAATLDGRKIRWRTPAVLTWAMDEASFGGNAERLKRALQFCTAATDDWNHAACKNNIYEKIHFEPADDRPSTFKFAFHPFAEPTGLLALAFFPNAPAEERIVYIGPLALDAFVGYDQVGIIRHELGHVLGFRHEHIREEAVAGMSAEHKALMEQWVTGEIGKEMSGQALTNFDGQSVMHYPINLDEGLGTLEFEISHADEEGFAALYSAPYNEATIREFAI